MKKFIIALVLAFTSMIVNAQSFEIHQSYNDKNTTWGSTRLIAEYFYTNEAGSVNVFSWNSFSQNGISGLLYGEYLIAGNVYLHGEVRTQFGNFEYNTITPEIGLAYLLPIPCGGLGIYLTPKYVHNDVYLAKNDFQFSINSAYESDYVYYEGYIDTNYVGGFNFFTEQKVYYKLSSHFQIGVAAVANATKLYNDTPGWGHIQPYLTARIGLY